MFSSESHGKPLALFAVVFLTLSALVAGQLISAPSQITASLQYPAQLIGFAEPNPGLVPPVAMPSVNGPGRSMTMGDPVSAGLNPSNSYWTEQYGAYTFQIDIPQSYPYQTVRVELFDPDTYNQKYGAATSPESAQPVYRVDGSFTTKWCDYGTEMRAPWNACAVTTRRPLQTMPEPNDAWFFRVDEIRWTHTGMTVSGADALTNQSWQSLYPSKYPVPTMFRLYYLREAEDGTLHEVDLAYYVSNGTDAHTDLMWVSPGASPEERMPAFDGSARQCVFDELGIDSQGSLCSPAEPITVTEDCEAYRSAHYGLSSENSWNPMSNYWRYTMAQTCAPNTTNPAGNSDFIVDLASEAPDIVRDANGIARLYVDVRTLIWFSKNNFMIAARASRSELQTADVPAQVNARQTYIIGSQQLDNPIDPTGGLMVSAQRSLPLNMLFTDHRDNPATPENESIPSVYPVARITAADAGRTLKYSLFDPDAGSTGPLVFFLDTIDRGDWSICFRSQQTANPDDWGNCAGRSTELGSGIFMFPNDTGWSEASFLLPTEGIGLEGATLYAEYYRGQGDMIVQRVEWLDSFSTATPIPTYTPTLSPTPSHTPTVTFTPTPTSTYTPTNTPKPTNTPTPTATSTAVPTSTPSATPYPLGPIQSLGTVTGTVIGSLTVVTSESVPAFANNFYIAAVATKLDRSVQAVTGLGLSWKRIAAQCSGRSQTRVEVWLGEGNPTSDGHVSATFATAPQSAVITVTRYINVDTSQPIGFISGKNTVGINDTTCTGGIDTRAYSLDLQPAAGSLIYSAFAMRAQTHTPGGTFTELAEITSGGLSGSASSLAIQHYHASMSGTVTLNGAASASTDWSLLAVELLPLSAPTAAPTPTHTATIEPTSTPACPSGVPSGVTARKHTAQSDSRTLLLEWEDISAACEAVSTYKVYVWRGTNRQEWVFNRSEIYCTGYVCRAEITFSPTLTQIYWRVTASNTLGEGPSDNTKSYAVP